MRLPPPDVVEAGIPAIIAYLSRPQPPYVITPTVIGALMAWIVSLMGMIFVMLRYLNWRFGS
jgi:hypothetical protein